MRRQTPKEQNERAHEDGERCGFKGTALRRATFLMGYRAIHKGIDLDECYFEWRQGWLDGAERKGLQRQGLHSDGTSPIGYDYERSRL